MVAVQRGECPHSTAQVLPSELLLLAEPSPSALAAELERALTLLHTVDAERQHRQARRVPE